MSAALVWMIVLASLAGAACALAGCYLVLRRMSLLGDAISHAVLPGLVVAFLLTRQLGGWPMLLGALAAGLLVPLLTEAVHRAAGVPEDAGLGVVFTSLFAAGVLLLNLAPGADLDPGCVLYGQLVLAAGDKDPWLGVEVPRSAPTLALALLLVAGFLALAWKEVKLTAFDAALAAALGLPWFIHHAMLALVATVTVASFEAVGSILVVAMLVVPPVTAQLLTERFGRMHLLAALVAVLSAVSGVLLAARWNTSVPGMMAVMAGVQLMLAWLLAPRSGLAARWWRAWALSVRIAAEDILARLYRAEQGTPADSLPRSWLAWRKVRRAGEIDGQGRLTEKGRARAASLVRAHRLWEAYLASEAALPLDHLHPPAEEMEHFLDEAMQARLAEALDAPERDPHGRPIPGGDR
ncbi:MAG: metal ABC transporter permease [Gemmataceae bacterium]|nr:metal ABC transporter permease [Gemmataceae bacterium]